MSQSVTAVVIRAGPPSRGEQPRASDCEPAVCSTAKLDVAALLETIMLGQVVLGAEKLNVCGNQGGPTLRVGNVVIEMQII